VRDDRIVAGMLLRLDRSLDLLTEMRDLLKELLQIRQECVSLAQEQADR
jgi:hypothetical protein